MFVGNVEIQTNNDIDGLIAGVGGQWHHWL
jgi:hypothetical protein